jgi:hypothetical protein
MKEYRAKVPPGPWLPKDHPSRGDPKAPYGPLRPIVINAEENLINAPKKDPAPVTREDLAGTEERIVARVVAATNNREVAAPPDGAVSQELQAKVLAEFDGEHALQSVAKFILAAPGHTTTIEELIKAHPEWRTKAKTSPERVRQTIGTYCLRVKARTIQYGVHLVRIGSRLAFTTSEHSAIV